MLVHVTRRVAAYAWDNAGRLLVVSEKPLGTHDKRILNEYDLLGLDVLGGHQVAAQLGIFLLPERPAAALVLGPMLLLVLPIAVAYELAAGAGEPSGHMANGTVGTRERHSNDHFTLLGHALILYERRKLISISRFHYLYLASFSKHSPLLTQNLFKMLFGSFS